MEQFRYKTRFKNVKPSVDLNFLGMNNDTLVLQHYGIDTGFTVAWTHLWLIFVMGIPGFIFLAIQPFLLIYTRSGAEIISFLNKMVSLPIQGYLFLLVWILLSSLILLFPYFLVKITTDGIALGSISPIIFNRKTKKVSLIYKNKLEEISWYDLRVRDTTHAKMGGSSIMQRSRVLELTNLADKTRIAVTLSGDGYDGRSLWEYICTFMEEGAEKLNVPIDMYTFDSFRLRPLYYNTFEESLKAHSFLPLFDFVNNSFSSATFKFLVKIVKMVIFIPDIITDWGWRKIAQKKFKNSKSTPQYIFSLCEGRLITATDALKVRKESEKELIEIPYSTIVKRLEEIK